MGGYEWYPALMSQSNRVSIVAFFFLFFSVSLPMASQGRSLVFSAMFKKKQAILFLTHEKQRGDGHGHMHVPAWENRTLASRPTDVRVCLVSKKKDVRVCHAEKRMRSGAHRPTNVRVPRTEKLTRSGRGVGAHADVMVGSGKSME